MARAYVERRLYSMGGKPVLRENFVTDNGNQILDVHGLRITAAGLAAAGTSIEAAAEPVNAGAGNVERSGAAGSDAAVVEEAAAGDDPRFDAVEARLSALMAGQALYREPALSIAQLARRSGYPEYLVSAVINRRLGGNFCEYVNVHRIEATRAALADPADARTILDIAYDAGFTAKSTFNTAFKRVVGETPSAYRRRHARSGDSPAPD